MNTLKPTKQKIMRIASSLFYQKGFQGTSIRDIAAEADVNIAAISYYFNGKQGLLEQTVTTYYETYLDVLEKVYEQTATSSPIDRLKKIIASILHFKQDNEELTCFISREMAFDSTFVREIVVTYLAKENYLIKEAFFPVLQLKQKNPREQHFLFMQLIGMLSTPYLVHPDLKQHTIGYIGSEHFVKYYLKTINRWLDWLVTSKI
ncbi:MAG TPA: forespore capture DNA-binding protein RefZ [Cerasibacillus sp.]|uniref:forespore capture DNA-binding protein RefZ n=1 Tax=Cerasibacillus sp. TaxID=2498711 RepID=UPI002F40E514